MAVEPAPFTSIASLAIVAIVAVGGCSGTSAEPSERPAAATPSASDSTELGDEELLELVRRSFAGPTERAAAALIDASGVRTAYIRADASTVFEVGSITKVFTGELLAEAVERGEVRLGDALGDHLEIGDAPVGAVSLRALAAHTGGLPRFPTDPAIVDAAMADIEAGGDGIDATLDDLLAHARGLEIQSEPGYLYSNIGAALLGQALAAAAGVDYPTLLADRLLEPLGLDGASLPLDDADVSTAHAGGFDRAGVAVEPTSLGAYAPVGGLHATLEDLIRFGEAVIDGELTGSAAQIDAIDIGGGVAIGYFWRIDEDPDARVLSHDGRTGSFSSVLLVDVMHGTAAIVLSNQDSGVGRIGASLLDLAP
ncbi:serine hydrolase domain-containing protein [Agrococcus sp. TSP3-2-1]|uniref:serine hydrolase domain-containing protein n=1 Tax=Agrococcus sp. TSP3-2-1 TaxID=2804583 RepID=UPI003CF1FEFE